MVARSSGVGQRCDCASKDTKFQLRSFGGHVFHQRYQLCGQGIELVYFLAFFVQNKSVRSIPHSSGASLLNSKRSISTIFGRQRTKLVGGVSEHVWSQTCAHAAALPFINVSTLEEVAVSHGNRFRRIDVVE